MHHTLINGDRESGVSIIELHEKSFDSGRILKQVKVQVPEGVTFPRFHTMMARLGGHSLAKVVSHYDYYRVNRKKYSVNEKKYSVEQGLGVNEPHAPKITKRDLQIDWRQYTAVEIHRRILAIGHTVHHLDEMCFNSIV